MRRRKHEWINRARKPPPGSPLCEPAPYFNPRPRVITPAISRFASSKTRSASAPGDPSCHSVERFGDAFHGVVPAGAVDVQIHEARHGGQPPHTVFPRALRHAHVSAPPDGCDPALLDNDEGVLEFLEWRERAIRVDG